MAKTTTEEPKALTELRLRMEAKRARVLLLEERSQAVVDAAAAGVGLSEAIAQLKEIL